MAGASVVFSSTGAALDDGAVASASEEEDGASVEEAAVEDS